MLSDQLVALDVACWGVAAEGACGIGDPSEGKQLSWETGVGSATNDACGCHYEPSAFGLLVTGCCPFPGTLAKAETCVTNIVAGKISGLGRSARIGLLHFVAAMQSYHALCGNGGRGALRAWGLAKRLGGVHGWRAALGSPL